MHIYIYEFNYSKYYLYWEFVKWEAIFSCMLDSVVNKVFEKFCDNFHLIQWDCPSDPVYFISLLVQYNLHRQKYCKICFTFI